MQWRRKLQLQNRISTPKRQKDDFEALFKNNFKRKIISAKIEKICWQFTFAALMQPFQYDLRSSAAKDNSITHAATAPSNLDAATTMRFAASRSKPAPIYERRNTKWQHSCSHSNAICHHNFKKHIELRTQEQPLVAKYIGGTIRDRNDRSRTRRIDEVPFIAGCSHFTRKNTRFRAPASSPQHSPCNIHAAITLRFAVSRSKPAPIYGCGNTKWQQSCSHSNAICHHSFKKCIELRTQEQPHVAKHIGGTIRDRKDRSRTRRTDEVPFIAGCSHFTRKTQGFVLRLPPHNIAHATFMQPLHCGSQHHTAVRVANLHLSTNVATPNNNNHAAIPMRSATTASRNA